MAKLYLKAKLEPVEIKAEHAKEVERIFLDDSYPKEFIVKVGGFSFRKNEIKLVQLEAPVAQNDYLEQARKYWQEQDDLLALPPLERAERAWGHFVLFYFGAKLKKPDESMKTDIVEQIAQHFADNPERTLPDPQLYVNILQLPYDFTMDRWVLPIIESHERQQQANIKMRKENAKKRDSVASIAEQSDEPVRASDTDLPF